MSHAELVLNRDTAAQTTGAHETGIRPDPDTIPFRRFRIYPNARRLTRNGVEIELGSRAFDVLIVLLRARGCVVSKEDMFRAVWPSTTVDEGNLRLQMTVLRKVLGPDRDMIKTIPGRGYLLADDVDETGPVPLTARNLPPSAEWQDAPSRSPDGEADRFHARLTALENETSLLRRALSDFARNRLFAPATDAAFR